MDGADDGAPCVDSVAHSAHHDCSRASVQAAGWLVLHTGRASMNHRQWHPITFISEVPGLAFLGSSQQNSTQCQPAPAAGLSPRFIPVQAPPYACPLWAHLRDVQVIH